MKNFKIFSSDWILTCDDNFSILENSAIVFDKQIIDIGDTNEIKNRYPDIKINYCGKNSVLMPGLINLHIHLEFSANTTTLKYGNFVKWLESVIENREILIENATTNLIDNKLLSILKTGTTTIGAVSSYGFDLNSCVKSKMNLIYFIEAIGSKPEMVDTLFVDFKSKLDNAMRYKSDRFIPSIAIHSPYSVHPFLLREVLNIAKENNLIVSTHFQESKAENDWLNYSSGEFSNFFNNFLQQNRSLIKPNEFLRHFKGLERLLFVHCVEANEHEINTIKELNGSIIHCPNSNRLLTNKVLDLKYIDDINLSLGTDGLSSNISLNLFDEMRNAFFIHSCEDQKSLAKKLLFSATKNSANALKLNKGTIEKGKDADIISFTLPDFCSNKEDIATFIILHSKQISNIFIQGEKIETF